MLRLVFLYWLILLSWISQANSLTLEEFANKEKSVRLLASDALHLALDTEDCGLSLCVDNCARHACSPTHTDNFVCAHTLRTIADCEAYSSNKTCLQLNLDFGKNGFVRVPPPFSNYSNENLRPEIKRAICAQSNLQFSASSKINLTFWNYFGSAEGVWRSFPGRVADPYGGCITYDPRKRPWYILATSVVKDLVVLLDRGIENITTFKSAQNVITELYDTFRVNDSFNVLTFSSADATLLRQSSVLVNSNNSGDLVTIFNITSLTNNGNGFSNISKGFETARTTINSSSKLKVPLQPGQIYLIFLVLTDGYFSKSATFNYTALQSAISDLNQDGVVVFFFSLGPGDADFPPDPLTDLRRVSCLMNSSVTYVSNTDAHYNPLWAIRPYFDYQARLRFKENVTFWTDLYEDFDGLGQVSTVTYPVFDNGILYGVAGVDVFVNASDEIIIQQKSVDPNVAAIKLECDLQNVNLSLCTKAVDPSLQPLCVQDLYVGEDPEKIYKKQLCCGTCTPTETQKKNLLEVILGVVGASVLVVTMMLIIAVLACKYRGARAYVREIQEDFAKASISTTLYTYKELKKATRNFHKDNKLGEGGFGEVFLGKFRDGTQVAVKKLSDDSKQGKPQFLAEVMLISRVQHRNLVKLRGCCVQGLHRLLVYEYLEKKSLRETLLGRPEETVDIGWPTRFNIATGTARGLAYLHDEIVPRIIHRDIKASNILLDANLEAKISDFGLAKLCPAEQTHLTTAIAGTLGYMAPEITRGQLSEKVDVFSYGILLMEIVAGRITMSITNYGTPYCLIDEIRDLYKIAHETGNDEHLLRLVDPRLRDVFNKEEVIRILKISLLCVIDVPTSRPSISQVILMLLGSLVIPEYLLKYLLTTLETPSLSSLELYEDDYSIPPNQTGHNVSQTSTSVSREKTVSTDLQGR